MGSSAQNSSGVDWCRGRVRFNEVSEGSGEGLGRFGAERSGSTGFRSSGEGLGGFGAEPGQVQEGSGEGLGGFGAEPGQVQQSVEPGQVQQGSGEGSGEGLGGFGADPGQVQYGSGEGSGEGLGGFGAKPSQVQRVPEKVAEKEVLRIFGAGPGSGAIGSAEGFQRLASQHASERLLKIKRRGCWGYHRSLFLILRFFFLQHLARDDYCIGGFSLAGLNRFCNPTTARCRIPTSPC